VLWKRQLIFFFATHADTFLFFGYITYFHLTRLDDLAISNDSADLACPPPTLQPQRSIHKVASWGPRFSTPHDTSIWDLTPQDFGLFCSHLSSQHKSDQAPYISNFNMASQDTADQQNLILNPISPSTPKPQLYYRHPLTRRSTTDSTISSTTSSTTPSLSTSLTSEINTPTSAPVNTTTFQIRKRILSGPEASNVDQILSTHKCLEEANNSVYAMRLAYETCDPCFFWYGDGHGSIHPDLIEAENKSSSAAVAEKKGDCLSWEVFTDEDAAEDSIDHERGCRVWVERVEHDYWNMEGSMGDLNLNVNVNESIEGEQDMSVGKKVLNWREALEPINRPCDFWGTFTVKSTGNFEARHGSIWDLNFDFDFKDFDFYMVCCKRALEETFYVWMLRALSRR